MRAGTSARSQAAAFAAILNKAFQLDDLVAAVTLVLIQRHGPAGAATP